MPVITTLCHPYPVIRSKAVTRPKQLSHATLHTLKLSPSDLLENLYPSLLDAL